MQTVKEIAQRAKAVQSTVALLSEKQKNRALQSIADTLRSHKSKITQANAEDIRAGQKAGLRASLLDRLLLTDERVEAMACAVEDVIRLPDPVGRVLSGETMKDGMKLLNIRVPLGVCGIIYEARPNVTVDAASLCLKAGNVSVLKGGKEAIRSNTLCMDLMRSAIEKAGVPADAMQLIKDT